MLFLPVNGMMERSIVERLRAFFLFLLFFVVILVCLMHTSIGKGSYNKTADTHFNRGWTSEMIGILIETQDRKLKWADI